MTELAAATGQASFKDRKVGLVVFGIFQILLGGLCALFLPLIVLGTMMDKSASLRAVVPGALFYAFLAAWFITMGVGSILARRWARALSLIFSCLWLACGVSALAFLLLLMPDIFAQMSRSGQMPAQAVAIAKIVMFGTLSFIYVFLPSAFLLFYAGRNVRATCEARDARERWTDRCPLPVLALSLMFLSWAASAAFMVTYNWATPVFGRILTGAAGAAVVVLSTAFSLWVAWGLYRLRIAAWWGAAALAALWGSSTLFTFGRIDLAELYTKMNLPAEQIQAMQQCGMPQSGQLIWLMLAWFSAFLVYLLYTKKFFKPAV